MRTVYEIHIKTPDRGWCPVRYGMGKPPVRFDSEREATEKMDAIYRGKEWVGNLKITPVEIVP